MAITPYNEKLDIRIIKGSESDRQTIVLDGPWEYLLEFNDLSSGTVWITNGVAWRRRAIDGVPTYKRLDGTGRPLNIRELSLSPTYTASTNKATYAAQENTREVYIAVYADPGALEVAGGAAGDYGAPQAEMRCIMLIDSPDDGVAIARFAQTSSSATQSAKIPLSFGKVHGPYTINSYFSRFDFKPDVPATAYIIGQ